MHMERDAVIHVRLPQALKKAMQRAAEHDGRTASSMIVHVLQSWCEVNGYVTPPRRPISGATGSGSHTATSPLARSTNKRS